MFKNEISNKELRVAIYLRLSDEDKNKINKLDDSESIKNQRNILIDEIKKRPEFKLIGEYCDDDLSGAGVFRPDFERLINDCKSGKIDVVLCKSQSRFSRDMEIIEKYIHNKFIEWNVRFISLTDNVDTNIEGNKKPRQINALVNEWYLEDTSTNIRSAFLAKMKQGEYISPFVAFGYEIDKNDNNKLLVDSIAADIVKKIFYLYLSGMGFTSIALYLNERNIPSPSYYKYLNGSKLNIISNRPREEIKWSANAIKKVLTNELYIGNLVQGKRTTISYKNHKIKYKDKKDWIRKENTHEAIVDINTFNKVQNLIKSRTKIVKNKGIVHIFSGKVFCFNCKRCMRKKNSKLHGYLVCSNTKDGYNNCINKCSIRYDILEKIILKEINKKIYKYYDDNLLIEYGSNIIKNSFIDQLNLLEIKKNTLLKSRLKNKKYLKALYEDKVNEIISNEQFKYLVDEYNNNEEFYSTQLDSIDKEIKFYSNKKLTIKNLKQIFKKYKTIESLNTLVIDEFIDKIYIGNLNKNTNSRQIYIKWNF